MENKSVKMKQLIFKFPFKTSYYEHDFYVSENNFEAYKLLEVYPKWPGKWINLYGPKGCGKTHLTKILSKKTNCLNFNGKNEDDLLGKLDDFECVIIDDFNENINEKYFYLLLNETKQLNKNVIINSIKPLNEYNLSLKDLRSRLDSFIKLGINLPNDEMLKVIITKYFSDKQTNIDMKALKFIINNVERSYEQVFSFLKKIDETSLSAKKSININLIKRVIDAHV